MTLTKKETKELKWLEKAVPEWYAIFRKESLGQGRVSTYRQYQEFKERLDYLKEKLKS